MLLRSSVSSRLDEHALGPSTDAKTGLPDVPSRTHSSPETRLPLLDSLAEDGGDVDDADAVEQEHHAAIVGAGFWSRSLPVRSRARSPLGSMSHLMEPTASGVMVEPHQTMSKPAGGRVPLVL